MVPGNAALRLGGEARFGASRGMNAARDFLWKSRARNPAYSASKISSPLNGLQSSRETAILPWSMKFLVISCSLNANSKSRPLAAVSYRALLDSGMDAGFLDLRDHPLPLCDGGDAYADPCLSPVREKLRAADGILLSGPIYNYDYNAAAKNLIELTGSACWAGKVVGFLAAAGGSSSYLSVMPLANSLMVDFRCVVIPRFVYADGSSFDQDGILVDEKVRERAVGLAGDLVAFTKGLAEALRSDRSSG